VFVHGLDRPWHRTWLGAESSVSWLQTLLPQHLPTACIIAGGFDAFSSITEGMEQFMRQSNVFLEALERIRQDVCNAYQLGGGVC
jgi:hypothetical protein